MARKVFTFTISCCLIALFIYAACSKLSDYHTSFIKLSRDPFLSNYASILVWAVPCAEIITVLLLAFPRTSFWGLIASLLLMLAFTVYVSLILTVATKVPCICAAIFKDMSWQGHLYFNIITVVFILITIILSIPYFKQRQSDSFTPKLSRSF